MSRDAKQRLTAVAPVGHGWRPRNLAATGLAALLSMLAATASPRAESEWNPFQEKDGQRRRDARAAEPSAPPLAPMGGVVPRAGGSSDSGYGGRPSRPDEPGFGAAYPGSAPLPDYFRPVPGGAPPVTSSKIERFDLEPARAADGSGMPQDVWRGMDMRAVEEAFAGLSLPPPSPALHALWIRLLEAAVDAPAGGRSPAHFEAVRLEALYRTGLLDQMGRRLEGAPISDPIFAAFSIRRDLALADKAAVCRTTRTLITKLAELPKALAGELQLLSGYCAATEGNTGGVGLAVDLAREAGVDAPVALAALDALAGNGKGVLTPPKQVHVLDYRLLELLGPIAPSEIIDRAEPALLAALARQQDADPAMRVAAAEAGARQGAISGPQLAAVYTSVPAGADDAGLRRAELVRVIAAETAPARQLQLMRSAMEDARKSGLLLPMAQVLATSLVGITPSPEMQAETGIEILLLAGDARRAREFASSAPVGRNWLALIDLAESGPSEAQREQDLADLDDLVRRGRFPADLLHRLATVLDATDVNVPIPLWEAASRTPQPSSGYLPETGVLAQLQDAAKKKDAARTILLAMRAIGPGGADTAHIIALGDSIRALRRAGFDADARRLAVEALIARWPRST